MKNIWDNFWNSTFGEFLQVLLGVALVLSMIIGLVMGIWNGLDALEKYSCNQYSELYPQYNFNTIGGSCRVQLAHGQWVTAGAINYPSDDLRLKGE